MSLLKLFYSKDFLLLSHKIENYFKTWDSKEKVG